jgi:hypothetical protein
MITLLGLIVSLVSIVRYTLFSGLRSAQIGFATIVVSCFCRVQLITLMIGEYRLIRKSNVAALWCRVSERI